MDGTVQGATGVPRGAVAASRLLGTLEFLIWRSGLNKHRPGENRTWAAFSARLVREAQSGRLRTRHGCERPLAQSLYVVPSFSRTERDRINESLAGFLAPFSQGGPRNGEDFLVLGEFRELRRTTDGAYLLLLRHTTLSFIVSSELLERSTRSFRVARAARDGKLTKGRGVVLLRARFDAQGRLLVADIAWQLMSPHYVLCDSGHELRLSNLLSEQGRSFSKPMSRDVRAGILPDFMLDDTQHPWALEVLGMHHLEYQQRFTRKIKRYGELLLPLWRWNAWCESDIPPLPPRAG